MARRFLHAWRATLGVVAAVSIACGGRTGDFDAHPDASLSATSSGSGVGTGQGTTGTSGSGSTGATGSSVMTGSGTASGGTSGVGAGGAGGAVTVGGTGGRSMTTGAGGAVMAGGAAGTGVGGAGGSALCGPGNCDGCCDAQYRCRPGRDLAACGARGAACLDCGAGGFACSVNRNCEGVAPPCGPMTCSGCCRSDGVCRFGGESDACGIGGGMCLNCGLAGQACSGGKCFGAPPKCDASNCGGCCDALGKCQPGTTSSVCGGAGAACQDCAQKSQTCTQPGSYCAAKLPCATVCPAGCCDAEDVCHATTDTACGTKGQMCLDCKAQGLACAPQGYCYSGPSCGSSSCAGCCTATGQCISGADTAACGQFGSLCDNCSAKNETCRGQVCSDGSTCPGTFAGCSPNAVTTPPQTSSSCTDSDMALVVRSCSGAATNCGAAFMRLLGTNPACAGCLSQFVGDDAISRCLAPFLSQACNHSLTCAASCTAAVCQCPPDQTAQCQSAAGQAGGACSGYAYGWSCALTAFQGPATFCNWDMYRDAGLWLSAVGGHYCKAR